MGRTQGIELTFSNVFKFFSAIAPFLLTFLMVMISIFNSNFKEKNDIFIRYINSIFYDSHVSSNNTL